MSDPEIVPPAPARAARPAPTGKPTPAPAPGPTTEPAPAPLGTAPEHRVVAEIYITPLGTGEPSIQEYIRALRPLLDASGLRYEQHALGTVVEGPLIHILELTRALHDFTFLAGKGASRVVTHLRIDERRDGEAAL